MQTGMLLRQERIAFGLLCVVALAILGATVVLGGIDRASLARDFNNDVPDGILARAEGVIDDLQPTRTGGHLMVRVENIRVFIPAPFAKDVELARGDRVCITGTVRTYQGEKEIVVQSREDIMVRER